MPEKQHQTWIVTASADRPVSAIADEIKNAGFTVTEVLEHTGNVIVRGDPAAAAHIRSIHGVADVSPDHTVDIGPPGAPVS